MAPQHDDTPLNFQELVETFGDEELALQMLQMCEPILISSLYELFDDLIYEKYKNIRFSSGSFKDRARFIGADSLANIIRDFRNASRDIDMFTLEEKLPAPKEKMKEIITECRRLHAYVCELLKMPTEDIDAKINKGYEIFDLYLRVSEPKICINYGGLIERYDRLNAGSIWPMIESTCYQIFQERDYFGEIYKGLLEQQYKELQNIGNSLAKLAGYMCANILREACQDLEDYAKEEDEEECYRVFIEIIEECLILERYVMVDRLRRWKKAEKWIELKPEFAKLRQKKNELPRLIQETKTKYQADKENERVNRVQKEEAKEEECKGESQLANQEGINVLHNNHKAFETGVLDPIPEEKELGSDQERKTDIIDLSISPSQKLDNAVIQNKVEETKHIHVLKKNEDEIKAIQRENIVIVSSQKNKNCEDNDYFPFDTGMKCAMF